jgi:hypothetical protein
LALGIYYRTPANAGTLIGQSATFVGNNVDDTFPYAPVENVGSTLQYSSTEKRRYDGGYSVDTVDGTVTIDAVPPLGAQGVIPSSNALVLSAYDSDSVYGVDDPRIDIETFLIGDPDTISTYSYSPVTGQPGIGLTFVNLITSVEPGVSWVQLACCDSTGSPLTFGATGDTLWITGFSAFTLVSASANANTTTIVVDDASTFLEGRYVKLNSGNVTSEIIQVSDISGNTMTMASSFNYPHYIGETIYECLAPIAAKLIVPSNATGGQAANFYNLAMEVTAKKEQRD